MRHDAINFFDDRTLPYEPKIGEPPPVNGYEDPGYIAALFSAATDDQQEPIQWVSDAKAEETDDIVATTIQACGPRAIPPRPWAYGHFLLFGKASVLGAVDGGGKGAIATTMMLAHIFGTDLLGEKVWRSGRVGIISYEDDETEWHRRIAAACIHYRLDYLAAMENIVFIHRPRGRVAFAAPTRDGIDFPDGDQIIKRIREELITFLIVDPFNHTHSLDDGNNNVLIAKVAAELDRVAVETQAAVMVLHHLRKGSNGNPDDLMGATSLRATFRNARILGRMTKEVAESLQIKEYWRYTRIVGSKENYAPPPDKATWFRLESVELGNATDEYPEGDNIGVATTWTPPSPWAGVPMSTVVRILDAIEAGLGDGDYYTGTRRGRANARWAGNVISDITGKSDDNAQRMIDAWTESGLLIQGNYASPKDGKTTGCVRVDPQKRAEMAAASDAPPPWDC